MLCATQLPIVIAVATLGVSNGRMTPEVASALIGAGVLSVFCYPLLGLAVRTQAQVA
jgi:hypothetical protein